MTIFDTLDSTQSRIILMSTNKDFNVRLIDWLSKQEGDQPDSIKILTDSIPNGEPVEFGVKVGEWFGLSKEIS